MSFFLVQFRALLWKCLVLLRRRFKSTFLHVFVPLIGIFVLIGLAKVGDKVASQNLDPIIREPVPVPRLGDFPLNPYPDMKQGPILYTPSNAVTDDIMNILAKAEGISPSLLQPVGGDVDAATIWFKKLFTDIPIAYIRFSFGDEYTASEISYNIHLPGDNGYFDCKPSKVYSKDYVSYNKLFVSAQRAVDEAILRHKSPLRSAKLSISAEGFPVLPIANTNDDNGGLPASFVVSSMSPLVLFTALTVPFIIVVHLVMLEKNAKVVGAMRVIGMSEGAYWLSWFVSLLIPTLAFTILGAIIGYSAKLHLLSNTNFLVYFLVNMMSSAALNSMAMSVAAPFKRPRVAYGFAFFVVVIALTFAIVCGIGSLALQLVSLGTVQTVSSAASFTDTIFYDPHSGIPGLRSFLYLFPFTHYIRIMDVISATTVSYSYTDTDSYEKVTIPGGHFGWHQLSHGRDIYTCCTDTGSNYGYTSGAPSENLWILLGLTLLYLALAWYFAQVFDSGNGTTQVFYFFLTKKYWRGSRPQMIVSGDSIGKAKTESFSDKSIRLHKVSKTYKDITALKELSLELRAGEVFCFLGHNGAGKSTTINIVSGQTSPTHGHCFVRGYDVDGEMDWIRPMLGICPQDDVLWPDLTAQEHLTFYGMFRGTPKSLMKTAVESLLTDVDLLSRAHGPSSTFSGGMKRRLSMAIACMGLPNIILLDEPTTGLDPLAKKKIWNLIQAMKRQERVVLLTTHSMEEADVLSDRIAMLSKGTLRASGTSLFLKNRFGLGYNAKLLCDTERLAELQEIVHAHLPSAEILDSSGGALAIAIPKTSAGTHIPAFFRIVDEHNHHLVKEWGISNTTLEEVFLRISMQGKAVEENALVDREAEKPVCKLCKINEAEPVVLYSATGVPVLSTNLVCSICCPPAPSTGAGVAQLEAAPAAVPPPSAAARPAQLEQPPRLPLDYHAQERSGLELQSYQNPQQVPISAAGPVPSYGYSQGGGSGGAGSVGGGVGFGGVGVGGSGAPMPSHAPPQATMVPYSLPPPTLKITFGPPRQVRALMGRSWALKKKQRKTLCCQIFFPILIIIIIVALRFTHILDPSFSQDEGDGDTPARCKRYDSGNPVCNKDSFFNQFLNGMSWTNSSYGYYPMGSNKLKRIVYPAAGNINVYSSGSCQYSGNGNSVEGTSWYDPNVFSDELFSALPFFPFIPGTGSWSNMNISWVKAPGNIEQEMLSRMKANKAGQYPIPSGRKGNGTYLAQMAADIFPSYAIGYDGSFNNRDGSLSYKFFSYFGNNCNNRLFGYTSIPPKDDYDYDTCSAFPANNNGAYQVLINAVHTAAIRVASGDSQFQMGSGFSYVPTVYWPKKSENTGIYQMQASVTSLLISFATFFLIPSFVHGVVVEKEERALEMMRIMGLRMRLYWLTFYLFNLFQSLSISLVMFIVALSLKIPPIVGSYSPLSLSHPMESIMLLIAWTHSSIGLSSLFCSLFAKGRSAVMISYSFVIITIIGCVVICTFLTDIPKYAHLFPPMAYISGLNDLCLGKTAWFQILMLWIVGTITLFLGAIIVELTTESSVIRRWIFNTWTMRRAPSDPMKLSLLSPTRDVQEERERVGKDSGKEGKLNLLVDDLSLVYPDGNRAVDHLSFGIGVSECFGLLGPNGAGKTTAVSVIHGHLKPTGGRVKVCGHDVVQDLEGVSKVMGVVTQHECLHSEMTVAEHLLFYARLQGVTVGSEAAVVQSTAESVELDGDCFNKMAGTLSGGQRRMLSLGVATVHSPKVICMDEPTTGLDPEMRRVAWRVISKLVKDKSVLLTTHSMEEAEALATRIGIVVHGSLRCVGTTMHLKSAYGSGYKLSIVVSQATGPLGIRALDAFPQWFASICPQANIVNTIAVYTLVYQLPSSTKVSTIFESFADPKAQWMIAEWGFAQASLEDVFIKVVEG